MVKVIAPSDAPLHVTFVADAEASNAVASVTVAEAVAEHPLESVTVTVYVPAVRPPGF